jgi:16S rRNA (guanine527-N7)-methyltransferase
MSGEENSRGARLNVLLAEAGLAPLDTAQADRFEDYLSLFVRWNTRINLTAIRDEDGILFRHFVESIACARALPGGLATLLDFGSGGGFPGIPIALCRPEIAVTLAESQGKKAAFLQEAVRVLGISAKVHADRAETLRAVFDCVVLRAVDRMTEAVEMAAQLVAPSGWLALMTTDGEVAQLQSAAGAGFSWAKAIPLPGSTERLLALGMRLPAGS